MNLYRDITIFINTTVGVIDFSISSEDKISMFKFTLYKL